MAMHAVTLFPYVYTYLFLWRYDCLHYRDIIFNTN